MKKTFPILAVVTMLWTGCAPIHRLAVVPNEQNTRFELQNISGRDLHDVRLKGWVRAGRAGLIYLAPRNIGDLTWDQRIPTKWEYTYGIGAIEIRGKCREGRVWADYRGEMHPEIAPAIQPIEPPPPAPPTETKYESSEAEMQRHLDKLKTPR